MIGFQLGREYKLSIAEILTVFSEWKAVYFDKQILIIDWINQDIILDKINNLWWTIKVFEIKEISNSEIYNKILSIAQKNEWKFKYWLNIFSSEQYQSFTTKNTLNKTKKLLKDNDISSRFVNKDFKNLSSAQILWEKLIKKWTDFNIIISTTAKEEDKEKIYFWKSIWVQNINEYSKRDYEKERNMNTWMLPPKLSQIMINLSLWKIIYDPFVWLWTILIESIIAWNNEVYWSDLNEKMVENTINNLKKYSKVKSEIIKLNAKYIDESDFLKKSDVIVTEWYLWEIMTKNNISIERIEKQKQSLIKIYESFFSWLKKANFKWNIIISFPYWEIKWKYLYFKNIYDIINVYCSIQKLFPIDFSISETISWSLLYKRDKQLVWREIFKLKIK